MKTLIRKNLCVLLVMALLLTWMPMLVQAEETAVSSFSFECHNKTGYAGEGTGSTDILGYSFEPYGASESVSMVSSDPSVASVEYDEEYDVWKIYYYKLGTATVTATTASGLTDTCTVTVAEKKTVSLNQVFTATVQPHDVVLFDFTTDTEGYYSFYSESGEGNLNINWSGKAYYGIGVDTQNLGANYPYVLAVWNDSDTVQSYTLRVRKSVPAEEIVFEQTSYSGYPGDRICIRVSEYPLWSIHEEPVFSSSDENVVYYDPEGSRWVTLANPGTATITARTQNGVSAQCTVTVRDYEVIHAGESKTITLDYQDERRYTFTPETDGEYVFYAAKGWIDLSVSCDGTSVGEYVDTTEYEGVSCEMEAGNTYILKARNTGDTEITQTVFLDEMDETKLPEAITITSEQNTVFLWDYIYLYCEPAGGNPFITGDVTWSVDNESVISLVGAWDGEAIFRANAVGEATVTATLKNGVSASYEVVVSENTQFAIANEESDSYIPKGQTSNRSFTITSPYPEIRFVLELESISGEHIYSYASDYMDLSDGGASDSYTVTVIIPVDAQYVEEGDYYVKCYVLYYDYGVWKTSSRMEVETVTVGAKVTGWYEQKGKWKFCDSEGVPTVGWKYINNGWYYFDEDGFMQTDWLLLGSTWYYFGSSGVMATGTVTIDGMQHKFDASGAWQGEVQLSGWVQEGGKWVYYQSGEKVTGWLYTNNRWYYFNNSGIMQTGWVLLGSTWYYMDASGAMVTGTVTIEGKQHKFNASGAWLGEVTQNGWVQESGKWVYYKNGSKVTGWLYVNNRWYYMNSSGVMQTGWVYVNNRWYYMDASGAMVTGWLQLGSTWYYMDASGAMVTGTVTIEGKKHSFSNSGAWQGEVKQSGWAQESGKWVYYQNGAKVKGWLYVNNRWYYFNNSGIMLTGWVQVGSTWYYMDASGAMLTGQHTLGGNTYYFDASGAWIP